MKGSTSILIIVVGLLVLWLGVTGKFDCFAGTLACMLKTEATGTAATPAAPGTATPTVGTSAALARVTAKLGGQGGLLSVIGTPPFGG